jgi:ABC-type Fe3+/spermidine/putrescine transport system ATPase subunit
MTPAVGFVGVTLGYDAAPVLAEVDLAVAAGEVVALLGPSGSGKTTLLHAVAGFVAPSAGEIWLAGRRASDRRRCEPPERRRVGMVFQNYALWPHLTVVDNVAYPVRRRGVGAPAARRRAMDLLARVDIAGLAGRRPAELSGGEQQRVGLARALAADPHVFLFDEPTAHLDAHLRAVVLAVVTRQRAETGAAALYATHDSAEALAIADRVAVLHSGRVAQVATPAEAYARPADLTVARLTGPVSVLDAPVRSAAPGVVIIDVAGALTTVRCDDSDAARYGGSGAGPILVRPDWAGLGGDLPGLVTAVRFGGPHTDYELETPAGTVLIRQSGPPVRVPGEVTGWSLERVWLTGPADVSVPGASPAAVPAR